MSNCIQVDKEYCPFRWESNVLEAWVKGIWRKVERTDKKNRYGEWIFRVVEK